MNKDGTLGRSQRGEEGKCLETGCYDMAMAASTSRYTFAGKQISLTMIEVEMYLDLHGLKYQVSYGV